VSCWPAARSSSPCSASCSPARTRRTGSTTPSTPRSSLKPLVHRTYIGQVVYPSGHTATIAALAATATVLLLAPPRPEMARPLRVLILAMAYLACVAVVVGVIAVRFHYFTDTVAGAAVGIGTVCGLALGISQFR
jgi:membrane-associated phospholipid phosphatase